MKTDGCQPSIFSVLLICLVLLMAFPGHCQAARVTLAWDAHYDPAVVGYNLYSGSASRTYGTPVNIGNITRYTVTGIVEGLPRYFAVTAYDARGYESAFSDELECFTLVPSAGANGAISPAATVVVSRGMSQTFSLTPAEKYRVADVLVDGVSIGAISSHTFSDVSACHVIAASFAVASFGSLVSFNNDANPDLLWRNVVTGQICITTLNGVTLTGMAFLPTVADPSWTIAGTADFNGDGSPDILWRNTSSGENCVWLMTGASFSGEVYLPSIIDQSWTIAGTGDFNGDGNPDILWRHTTTGDNCIWYMIGTMFAGVADLPAVTDQGWTIAGTGDFNGDGNPDILWRHTTTGDNCIWYMIGAMFAGMADLPAVTDQGWTIAGTGDFNQDGYLDILWSHVSSGQNYLWYMNGATVAGGVSFVLTADPNWMIY